MTVFVKSALVSFLCLAFSGIVFAAPPNAGQLLREQQPQRQLLPQLPALQPQQERSRMKATGVKVLVKGFKFTGYEGLATESELQALVSKSVGKRLDFTQLQGLAGKVTRFLRDKGWFLARAYLPSQDVTAGVIEIAIVQGRSDGSLRIKRDKSTRIRESVLREIGALAVSPGSVLSQPRLERSILLMNDLPGVFAHASLSPGSDPGTTAVQVDTSEGPLVSGALWGDNYGNRYTGTDRGNLILSLNDPFRYGDHFSLLLTGSQGLTQGKASYSFPLSASGLRGNVSYTGMHYKLIRDLSTIEGSGHSNVADAGLSYPLVRSRLTNVSASLIYEYKDLVDSLQGETASKKKLHTATFGLTGNHYDTVMGGGYTTWNCGITAGVLDISGFDASITGEKGNFAYLNLGLGRLQRIGPRLTLNLSWRAQLSTNNLDSSEQFYLGGPYGVRAYPVGEASGDEGQLVDADVSYAIPAPEAWGAIKLDAFYNAGEIVLHQNPWTNSIVTATGQNTYWLQGAGAGLRYTYKDIVSLETSWAHVIGTNAGRSLTGLDSDGRKLDNRFWFQGIIYL